MKIYTLLAFVICLFLPNPILAKQTLTDSNKMDASKAQTFYFGTKKPLDKGIAIDTPIVYNPNIGYGFDFGTDSNVTVSATNFYTDKPTYFSIDLPEGNYSIEVRLGNKEKASNVTIKAESRRLMLYPISIKKGSFLTKTFNVNIRNTKIDANTKIELKDRDKDILDWDNKLTLEFLGNVTVQSIKITPVDTLTVVYLAGDSTVTNQDEEPWASWGQFITNYFNPEIAIANYAYSGSSLSSFKASNRLKKINSLLKPGDYLFIEFGHNDEKLKGPENTAWESYSNYLSEFVAVARAKGAIPILITPTQRRFFETDGSLKATHGDFPEAMRAVAKKMNVPLIDITQMTTQLYEKWGDAVSRKAFVQYPANTFPGQEKALEDNTHFNSFGANEIALCVIKGIRELNIPLKNQITKETPFYDPKNPNSYSNWTLPMSTRFEKAKPEGH